LIFPLTDTVVKRNKSAQAYNQVCKQEHIKSDFHNELLGSTTCGYTEFSFDEHTTLRIQNTSLTRMIQTCDREYTSIYGFQRINVQIYKQA